MWTALVLICSLAEDPSSDTCFVSMGDFFLEDKWECEEAIALAFEDGLLHYPPLDEYDREWVPIDYMCISWEEEESI